MIWNMDNLRAPALYLRDEGPDRAGAQLLWDNDLRINLRDHARSPELTRVRGRVRARTYAHASAYVRTIAQDRAGALVSACCTTPCHLRDTPIERAGIAQVSRRLGSEVTA